MAGSIEPAARCAPGKFKLRIKISRVRFRFCFQRSDIAAGIFSRQRNRRRHARQKRIILFVFRRHRQRLRRLLDITGGKLTSRQPGNRPQIGRVGLRNLTKELRRCGNVAFC